MNGPIVLTLDQLARPQPGGIGTYVRGLVQGLAELRAAGEATVLVEGVAPRASGPTTWPELAIPVHRTRFGEAATTRLWRYVASGVPAGASVVHATSMTGPFGGGQRDAVHSVAVQDLLWRDHPELTTRRGASFHEQRLGQIRRRDSLRVLVTSEVLRDRLIADGFAPSRLFQVRLGHNTPTTSNATMSRSDLGSHLATAGVDRAEGNYTLAVGTIEPRKNYERLIVAHARARMAAPELGPLLIAGVRGWGEVDLTGAVELGPVDAAVLRSLVANCRVAAYLPVAEGWGLSPIEALSAGRPVVASRTVPSVLGNENVVLVDPLDIDDVVEGLLTAVAADDSETTRRRRSSSVEQLTWANCARDHLVAWT